MDKQQLDNLVKQINISPDQILREEAEMIFLDALAKDKLGSKVVFYGGTALRLAYGSSRFSEDIDLIKIKPISFLEFEKFITQLIKINQNWQLKDLKDKRQTMFAIFLITDKKLKHNFFIRIEMHKPSKKINLESELSLIKSPASVLEPLLLAPSLEKLKELKIQAVTNRKKARDIFDLWYISQTLKEKFYLPKELFGKYQRRAFKNELQVFLPKKYYPVIDQLYDKINSKN